MKEKLKNMSIGFTIIGLLATVFPSLSFGEAYFEVGFGRNRDTFIIKLADEKKINQARQILRDGTETKIHVMGTIAKARASYNAQWSFHLLPKSIEFFEMSIEVCDASARYIEEHLDEIGGSTLPNGHWCPWNSRLTKEIIFGDREDL